MGSLFLAIVLALVSGLLWLKFRHDAKKNFLMYDKEHSDIFVNNVEEFVSKLNQKLSFGISNIVSESNRVCFMCQKNDYIINIENGTAYVDYNMSGCKVGVAPFGGLTEQHKFWKSARKAMLINTILDTFKNDYLIEKKTYQKTKTYAKSAIIAFVASLIFIVIGLCSFTGSVHNDAVSDAKSIEFCDGVTYEKLIDAYLIDPKWSAFNGNNDIAVVEVTGISVEGEDICIQFRGDMGMGFDYRDLSLNYFEADGITYDPDSVMEYIYLYYYKNK